MKLIYVLRSSCVLGQALLTFDPWEGLWFLSFLPAAHLHMRTAGHWTGACACWESTLLLNCISAAIFPCLYPRPPAFLKQTLTEWLGLGLHSFCTSLPSSWCARLKFLKFVLLLLFLRLYLSYVLTVLTELALNSGLYLWNYRYTSPSLLLFFSSVLLWFAEIGSPSMASNLKFSCFQHSQVLGL